MHPTAKTQLHLDRCLTCRSCETTCPSGVEYGKLLDIGRALVEAQVGRTGLDWLSAPDTENADSRSAAFYPAAETGTEAAALDARRTQGEDPSAVCFVRS